MNKQTIGIGVVVLVLIIAIGGYVMLSNQNTNKTGVQITNAQPSTTTQPNIADASFAGTVYEEWPTAPTGDAVTAIGGFSLSPQAQADGSTLITITNNDTKQIITVSVPKNDSLYIQEKNLRDDSEGVDKFTQDDLFLVVDGSGNVINTYNAGP